MQPAENKLGYLNAGIKKAFAGRYGILVFGHGNANAKIILVGEAPGREEEKHGRPFVGRAGGALNHALQKAGLKRESVYITNAVKFRPPNNRKPKAGEIKEFLPFLRAEIETLKPMIVCLLGSTATEALLGKYPVTKNHGRTVKKNGIRFLITFHPAAVLRNPNLKGAFEKDIRKLKAAAF